MRTGGSTAFRRWLAEHSVVRQPGGALDEDWYSSADTQRVASQLRVAHQLVVGWASGQHAPTPAEAAALEQLGGPPAAVWEALEVPLPPPHPEPTVHSTAASAEALDAQHLRDRCACAAHQVIRAASDYEQLPASSRKLVLRKVLAVTEATEAACEFRRSQGGAHELRDVAFVVLDRPDAVPFDVWEAEAWARIEDLGSAPRPSTLGPHHLAGFLQRIERSGPWLARQLGVSDEVVRNLGAGRSKSVPVDLAFSIQELGGPCYLHWLRLPDQERSTHRARPAMDWPSVAVLETVGPLASAGASYLRAWVAAEKVALIDRARACGTTRQKFGSWAGGAALPTLQEAWGVYWAGGPPVYSWLVDRALSISAPASSTAAQQRLARVRGAGPVAGRTSVEHYREQARWAVSRPISGTGPKPQGEALDLAYDLYRRRCDAARALLRASAEGLAEAVRVWEKEWAVEYVDGAWVPPWERGGGAS